MSEKTREVPELIDSNTLVIKSTHGPWPLSEITDSTKLLSICRVMQEKEVSNLRKYTVKGIFRLLIVQSLRGNA